jgi:hypothetical protein
MTLIGELDITSDVMLSVPGYRDGNMHIGVINVTYVYTDSYRFPDSLYITQTLSLINLFSNNHLEKKIYLMSEVL